MNLGIVLRWCHKVNVAVTAQIRASVVSMTHVMMMKEIVLIYMEPLMVTALPAIQSEAAEATLVRVTLILAVEKVPAVAIFAVKILITQAAKSQPAKTAAYRIVAEANHLPQERNAVIMFKLILENVVGESNWLMEKFAAIKNLLKKQRH